MSRASNLFALDDQACLDLAKTHGTPVFIYHAPTARAAFAHLRAAMPKQVRIAYAVKANPHPDLLRAFAELGASFDCASAGELERVAALGLPRGRIFFTGPGKQRWELELAVRLGARIQAESWEDLKQLDDIVTEPVFVNLRIHPQSGVDEPTHILGGVGPSAFGVDEEDVPDVLKRASTLRKVRIRGIHVFAASNQLDAEALLRTYRMVFELARQTSIDLEHIDLGGGLGVPYNQVNSPLDIARLGCGLAEIMAKNTWFSGEVIIEPGRYLAAPCGVYLSRIIRCKQSRGVRFTILQAGINHLLRPLLTGQTFPVRAFGKSGPEVATTLAGPLCTSLDRLGEIMLPALDPGDLIAFGMTGAYGAIEAMPHFLSHPPAKEVWLE